MSDPYAAIATPAQSDPYASIASPATKAAPAPAILPTWEDLKNGVTGAYNDAQAKLKGDLTSDAARTLNRAPPPNLLDFARQSVDDVTRSARMVGDVGAVIASPFAGATNALVTKPAAIAATKVLPFTNQADNEKIINTALMAAGPEVDAAPISIAAVAPRAAAPVNALAEKVAAFDRAGVQPNLAVMGGKGAATTTNFIAENPIAGAVSRNRLAAQVGQVDASADRLAGQYGSNRGPQITGENVQSGVDRFANSRDVPAPTPTAPAGQSSFAAKADALYGKAFGDLDTAMAGKTDPSQTVQVLGADHGPIAVKTGGSAITTPATSAVLKEATGSVQAPSLAAVINDPTISKLASAVEKGQGDLSFSDLRQLRTWVRDAQGNDELRQTIGNARLGRLEGALTSDIYSNADTLGSPTLSQQLRRADQYYAAGSQRIQSALQPFADAQSGESAYNRIVQAASSGASADAQKLLSLKRSLSSDEWGDVAATTIKQLGQPTKGAAVNSQPETGFSLDNFVSKYAGMSPRAREIMFGSIGGGGSQAGSLKSELDNLVNVAGAMKSVSKGANASKSAVSVQGASSLAGLLTPHTTLPTAGILGSFALTGEAMTNPAVVRALAGLVRAKAAGPGAYAARVNWLRGASRTNAALQPLYQQALKSTDPSGRAPSLSAPVTQPPPVRAPG